METKMASSQKSKKSTPRYNPISKRRPTRSSNVAASDDDDEKEPGPVGLRDSPEAKMASCQKSKKSTPRYNPISKRRSTRSTVAASDDEKEPSRGGLRDSPENVTVTETAPEENKGLAGSGVEAENVATVSAVAGTMTNDKRPDSKAGCDDDVAVVGEDVDPFVADNANLTSGDAIDDNGKPIEFNFRDDVAVDGQIVDNPIDGDPFLSHENNNVNADSIKGGTRKDNLGVDAVSNLNFSCDGVEREEEKNMHFCVKDDTISLDGRGAPEDVVLDSVMEDKSNDEANNVGVSEEAMNLNGKDVGGENQSCAKMELESNVVENGIYAGEEKQLREGQNDGYIHQDHSQLGCNQDSEHDVVEEECPAAEFEDKETLGCFDDISGPEESDDGKEEVGNSEDDREEDGNVESENDGDHSEDSKDDEDDNEGSEDDKDKTEENGEDEDPCKSIDNPLSRKKKGMEIHVGGLHRETVDNDLIEVFGKFGDIQETRMIKHPSGRSKGYAFIRYATIDQARNAVSELKDGIEVRGKRVKVSASQEIATLIMDNICKSWTKDHVLKKLNDYGIQHIEKVYLPYAHAGKGKIKGFALLEFSSHIDAMAALKQLRRPDAIFGCDRSAEVALASCQVQSIGDLSQVKSSISRRKARRQKVMQGGFKVKEISEMTPIPKAQVHAKSIEAEECEKAEQACSSRTKGKGSENRMKADSEEKRKSMKLKITGSKSNRPKSRASENRVAAIPSKSTKIHHERKRFPSNYDDRGKRKVEHDYNTRPSKKRGNKRGTTRNAIRSPRRNPQVGVLRHAGYHDPSHGAISGSKRLRSDMEPHAGYFQPAALRHIQHHAEYREPDLGNQQQRRLAYLEPALGSQSLLHAKYFEPSLGREFLSHVGYLERASGIQSHSVYHHGLRRDAVYGHVSSSTYGRVSARPSYVPHSSYLRLNHGGYEVDSSQRVASYHLIGQTYPLPLPRQ